jgi:hypothetical protein
MRPSTRNQLTASAAEEAVEQLGLAEGSRATVLVTSTERMLGVGCRPAGENLAMTRSVDVTVPGRTGAAHPAGPARPPCPSATDRGLRSVVSRDRQRPR